MKNTLLALGCGYSAKALSRRLIPQGWHVLGTIRDMAGEDELREEGITPVPWDAETVTAALSEATHLLITAGPGDIGDPSLALCAEAIAEHGPRMEWIGYLSTTGVYGDHGGDWINEDTPLRPSTPRGQKRLEAERNWSAIPDLPLHIFRLAGIYGPGRGPFAKLRSGKARRIIKPGQVFSRIHVDDIAQVLEASIRQPSPGSAYNLCDDDPAPPQDVIAFAAELIGLPVPPAIPFEEAEMTPMARSFYAENKRVSNRRIKDELGVELFYPDYRAGLRAEVKG
ncbi:SDR family oxidoreductase [Salipiger pallidus]|nr:SDR family oxidoreductase [Salipiger pallidus]